MEKAKEAIRCYNAGKISKFECIMQIMDEIMVNDDFTDWLIAEISKG